MNNKVLNRNKHQLLAFVLVLLTSSIASAQQFHTLYWMQGIPQSTYANPALQPLPNVYVGLPALSSFYTGGSHSGFALRDLFKQDANGRLFIDDRGMLNKLDPKNYLVFDLSNDWIAFGFRVNQQNYFSFNLTERVETRFGYSRDLMRLVIEGNDAFLQEEVGARLDGFSIDASHFREYGIGYSRKWDENLTTGIRGKLLQGMGNINFERTHLELFTGPNNYELKLDADMLANTSLPFQLAPLDELGDNAEFEEVDTRKYLTNFGNMGFAFDLGAVYNLNERFVFAMSIRDLGLINWKSDVENFSARGEVEFKGIDFNDFFNTSGNDNDDDQFGQILDSVLDLFDRQETTNAYSIGMTPKFFVSAAYNLSRMHKFAVLGKGEVYSGTLYPSLSLSYNFQPINRFGSSLSYSIIHGNYHNVGFGMHVNIFPIQIYVVTDNFFGAMQPHTVQTLNVHFGVNIVAGYAKENKTSPRYRW